MSIEIDRHYIQGYVHWEAISLLIALFAADKEWKGSLFYGLLSQVEDVKARSLKIDKKMQRDKALHFL